MGEQNSVLILGENPDISNNLKSDLESLGFRALLGTYPDTDTFHDKREPDIALLDFTADNRDTLSVGLSLFNDDTFTNGTAVVVLVSGETIEKIPLSVQFADIIRFPCDIKELDFRLHRVMYLAHREPPSDIIRFGNLSISPSRYEVTVNRKPVSLRYKEYELLKFFVTHPDRVFSRQELLASVWYNSLAADSRTVDVHIRRLREKIGDTGCKYIKTVRGIGYVFRSNLNKKS